MQQKRLNLQHQRLVLGFHLCRFIYAWGKESALKSSKPADPDKAFEPLKRLIQVMRKDPVINAEVMKILKLDPYQRRFVLNNWLEQLRLRNASENLLSALSCLFDDNIAEKVLTLINEVEFKRKVKKS